MAAVDLSLEVCGVRLVMRAPSEACAARIAARFGLAGRAEWREDVDVVRAGLAVRRISANVVEVAAGECVGHLSLDTCDIEAPDSLLVADVLVKIALSHVLPQRRALLMHASATEIGDGAVVCFGRSGSGKTTVARHFGRAMSDELVALHLGADGTWEAQGTPWWHGRCERVPLSRLVWLVRGEPSRVTHLRGADLVPGILSEAQWFEGASDQVATVAALASKLAEGGGTQIVAENGRVVDLVERALRE